MKRKDHSYYHGLYKCNRVVYLSGLSKLIMLKEPRLSIQSVALNVKDNSELLREDKEVNQTCYQSLRKKRYNTSLEVLTIVLFLLQRKNSTEQRLCYINHSVGVVHGTQNFFFHSNFFNIFF